MAMNFEFDRRTMIAGSLALGACATTRDIGSGPIARTTNGPVRGLSEGGILVFKGVRYGADTAGANRFMPPKAPSPWRDPVDAFDYGNSTPQGGASEKSAVTLRARGEGWYESPLGGGRSFPENEDCLFLNVWTPALKGQRPVMVWLHGGGFTVGSGSSEWYDGVDLAREQDVVLVTINHRLNVHGFTDLSRFDPRFAGSGNAGLLDCVAALDWVKANIENFGGDPGRVMIFGESGGGRKVSVLMATKPAVGLFHRAAVQSGSHLVISTADQAAEKAGLLLDALDIPRNDPSRLQQVPKDALWKAQLPLFVKYGQWQPVIDGATIAQQPFIGGAPAITASVPMIIGTNRTEQSIFLGLDPATDTLTEASLAARLNRFPFDGKADAVVADYRRQFPERSLRELLFTIATDRTYFLDSTIQAAAKAKLGKAPAYYYVFEYETPVLGGRLLTPHASEIPFVFSTTEKAERMVGPDSAEIRALARTTSTAWATFARTGTPAAPGLPKWVPYDTTRRPTMVLAPQARMVDGRREWERARMAPLKSQQELGWSRDLG